MAEEKKERLADTRNKFSLTEQEWLIHEIAERYFKGIRQVDVANELNQKFSSEGSDKRVTQQLISYYLKKLQHRWQKDAAIKIDAAKGRELAKIDNLERTYWRAWEQSLKPVKVKKSKKAGDKGSAEVNEFDSLGDHKYLDGVQRCIDKRISILGLDAPKKFSGTMLDITINWTTVDKQQALRIRTGEDPLVVLRPDQYK